MKNLKRQRVRLVASDKNHLNLDKLLRFYASNRETFNEDATGNLGFEHYQLRQLRAIKRHWYLSFVA